MRLWTIHPEYLDAKGIVALWREGLLAKAVLDGKTKGYRNHPQLIRFRQHERPYESLCVYLRVVLDESRKRGYRFDATKLPTGSSPGVDPIEETQGQLEYEWRHLLSKLRVRDPAGFERISTVTRPVPHPLFVLIPGDIRGWEKVL